MKRFLTSTLLVFLSFHTASAHVSEADRESKHVLLMSLPVGIAPGANLSEAGYGAGVFLSANDILSVEMSALTGGLNSDPSGRGPTFEGGVSYGLHYKHFLLDSLYFTTGLNFYQFDEGSGRGTYNEARRYTQNDTLAADVAVGSGWQWGAFTLGCDWVGYVVPLAKNLTHGGPVHFQSFLAEPAFEFLHFYLGVAF